MDDVTVGWYLADTGLFQTNIHVKEIRDILFVIPKKPTNLILEGRTAKCKIYSKPTIVLENLIYCSPPPTSTLDHNGISYLWLLEVIYWLGYTCRCCNEMPFCHVEPQCCWELDTEMTIARKNENTFIHMSGLRKKKEKEKWKYKECGTCEV